MVGVVGDTVSEAGEGGVAEDFQFLKGHACDLKLIYMRRKLFISYYCTLLSSMVNIQRILLLNCCSCRILFQEFLLIAL